MPPIIAAIGTIGNILTLITVTSRQCKKSSFTVYLGALAIFDTLVLYTVGTQMWTIFVFGVNYLDTVPFICKANEFTLYVISGTSSWLVVALTVERAVVTYFPLHSHRFNKPRTGIICVVAIFAFLVCINAHLLYGFEFYDYGNFTYCSFVDVNYFDFYHYYWTWIGDFVMYCILPVIIIITANIATVLRVIKSRKSTSSTISETARQRKRHLFVVTLMVSITFVVLSSPPALWNAISPYIIEDTGVYTPGQLILETIVYFMWFLNHSLNFYLYILSGRRFRKDLKNALVGCLPRVFRNRQ